jgi:hypothetical protein
MTVEKESNNLIIGVNAEFKTVKHKVTQNLQVNVLDGNEVNMVQLDNLNKTQDEVSELQKMENHLNLKNKQNIFLIRYLNKININIFE